MNTIIIRQIMGVLQVDTSRKDIMNTIITFCTIRFNGMSITAGFVDDISKKAWLIQSA